MPNHYYLEIGFYHLSADKAKKFTIRILEMLGVKQPKGGWDNSTVIVNSPKGQVSYSFRELVKEARLHGYIPKLHHLIDNQDVLFGSIFGVATNVNDAKYTCTFLNYNKELKAPLRIYPIENEIVTDILYFRKEACNQSNLHSFELTCRFYRSYLFSCISLVEAFINRHLLFYEFERNNSPQVEELKNTFNLVERIELLFQISTGKNIDVINKGIEWDHFMKLKDARNELIHSTEPFYGFEIKHLAKNLNYVRNGIGGFLHLIRKHQNKRSLSFIERLVSAPEITYVAVIK
ncbi:MAG: hypothetical protein JM58_00625 [Peptococcaceae bacterium BICA1-8]|nr:MAG: hypothetical protein JM58_00625 [Peptococcaceae bacterium BICA1-8]